MGDFLQSFVAFAEYLNFKSKVTYFYHFFQYDMFIVHPNYYPKYQITFFPHFYFAELAKRFTKQKSSKKVSGKSLRSKIGKHHSLTESSSMSNLFNDTTRLRLGSRPSLSNMFSHEAPLLTRPKDPPPPPPPVEQVLLPVTPPRKCFPLFTSDELKRINSVINGQSNGEFFLFFFLSKNVADYSTQQNCHVVFPFKFSDKMSNKRDILKIITL